MPLFVYLFQINTKSEAGFELWQPASQVIVLPTEPTLLDAFYFTLLLSNIVGLKIVLT